VKWQRGAEWPELPASSFVSGRAATEADVAAGSAVFVLKSAGIAVGVPIPMSIPQYALHRDIESGVQTPGVIIQAETASGQNLVGFLVLPAGTYLAGALPEFQLLGTTRPSFPLPRGRGHE
jgi:hypothetical protein